MTPVQRQRVLWLLATLVLVAPPLALRGQTARAADSSWVARLKDGSTHVGALARETPDSVELTTSSGRITIARSSIARLRHVSNTELHAGAYWPQDPHDTRLFFGPTPILLLV